MNKNKFKLAVDSYKDFPKEGILFRDVLPIISNPSIFSDLIKVMSSNEVLKNSDAIIAIDARGFIFGSAIAFHLSKPLVVARKPGKLPGELITSNYELEYGKNSLSIQKNSIEKFSSFAIVDDLLATGGTANCAYNLIKTLGKEVTGLAVVAELRNLKARQTLKMKVVSQIEL